jgi:hypothetical protein
VRLAAQRRKLMQLRFNSSRRLTDHGRRQLKLSRQLELSRRLAELSSRQLKLSRRLAELSRRQLKLSSRSGSYSRGRERKGLRSSRKLTNLKHFCGCRRSRLAGLRNRKQLKLSMRQLELRGSQG